MCRNRVNAQDEEQTWFILLFFRCLAVGAGTADPHDPTSDFGGDARQFVHPQHQLSLAKRTNHKYIQFLTPITKQHNQILPPFSKILYLLFCTGLITKSILLPLI